MTSEDKIIQALKSIEDELPAREQTERLQQIVADMFEHQSIGVTVVTVVPMIGIAALAAFAVVRFLDAVETRDLVMYATIFMACVTSIALLKIWYWLRWSRNTILREIKRLELRVAIAEAAQAEMKTEG